MNCPEITAKCPENPDKTDRTDTRARIGNPDIVRCPVPVRFARPVSGLVSAQEVSIHGTACALVRRGDWYAVMRDDQVVATADRRFLAVARAGAALHKPSPAAPQQGD